MRLLCIPSPLFICEWPDPSASGLFSVKKTAGFLPVLIAVFVLNVQSGLGQTSPVTLTTLFANTQADASVLVKWHSEIELNILHYKTERSNNGASFTAVGTTNPTNNTGGDASYSFTDRSPLNGDNYYRIKAVSTTGQLNYTYIVKVRAKVKDGTITVFPTPLTGRVMYVKFENKPVGKYSLYLINNAGQTVHTEAITITGPAEIIQLRLNPMIPVGNYRLVLLSAGGTKEVKQVIIQ